MAWIFPGRVVLVGWILGFGACSVALFALGFDWMRWIASIAFSALIAAAGIVAMLSRSRTLPTGSDDLYGEVPLVTAWVPVALTIAVAVYLAALAPVGEFVLSARQAIDFFLNLGMGRGG